MWTPLVLGSLLTVLGGFSTSLENASIEADQTQQCLHGPAESPEQQTRRSGALGAARNVNNMEWNQPNAKNGQFLSHDKLASSPFALKQTSTAFAALNLAQGAEILPGWVLSLDVADRNYWFKIQDKTDACGFAYISSAAGVIYSAEPIR
jgi:hypothetical protein